MPPGIGRVSVNTVSGAAMVAQQRPPQLLPHWAEITVSQIVIVLGLRTLSNIFNEVTDSACSLALTK